MSFESNTGLGVVNHYGTREVNEKYGALAADDIYQYAYYKFTYDALPARGATGLEHVFPSNCTIVEAAFIVDTPFTSTSTTTDLKVGLYKSSDGTEIDAEALFSVGDLTQTVIADAGKYKVSGSNGTYIGYNIGADAAEVTITPTVADLTAGAGRLVVKYMLNK